MKTTLEADLTVGLLKEFIENLPDETPVYVYNADTDQQGYIWLTTLQNGEVNVWY